MPGPLRVLILDDDPTVAATLVATLSAAGYEPDAHRVATDVNLGAALTPDLDLALVAAQFRDGDPQRAIALLGAHCPDVPVIVVAGGEDEPRAAELIRHGADDWLARDHPSRLGAAVAAAIERRRLRRDLARGETARREAEGRLARLEAALDASGVAVTIVDPDCRVSYLNRACVEMLGFTVEDLQSVGLAATVRSPQQRDEVRPRLVATGSWAGEIERVAKDGRIVPTWVQSHAIRDEAAQVTGFITVSTDISELKRAEAEIVFQAAMLDQVSAAVIGTDAELRVTHWNREAETLYGWTRQEAIGRPIGELLVPVGSEAAAIQWLDRFRAGTGVPGEFLARRKDGSVVTVLATTAIVRDAAGGVVRYVGVAIDLTDRKALEAQLRDLGRRDPLTGLPNRAGFLDSLHEAIVGSGGSERPVAAMILDLDRFKVVNDSLGHRAGDRLLRGVAERLRNAIGPQARLARLGGDEFGILYPDASATRAQAIAARALAALAPSFEIDDREAFIGGSVGIAVADTDAVDADELLRRADVALYEAKASGEGRVAVFDRAIGARAAGRLSQETELRNAVELGQFVVHFQPIVDLATGRVRGFEALVRWLHPRRGMLQPGQFLPLAEQTGLIVPIGEWVLSEACHRAVGWQALRPGEPPLVAVNVSTRQLVERDFAALLGHVLRDTGLPPSALMLEVTEDAIGRDGEAAVAILEAVKRLGVHLALDDFGTGHSSLARLGTLPLDVLKIDQSFVAQLTESPRGATMVRTMATIGHQLGLSVTAEGIETEAQGQLLRQLGCDTGQGFLFGRPRHGGGAAALLTS